MPKLAELHFAVTRTLASNRLGTPVFVRYMLHTQDKPGEAINRLAQVASVVRDWLGQSLDRIYAVGTIKAGQVSLTLEFRGGATALVGWTSSPDQGVDLMILGNHGAMYHDAGAGLFWEEPAGPLTQTPPQELVDLIQRALRSGRPESAGGQP